MDPIAVIGLDLKFPGDATDSEAFFKMLQAKGSALSEIPKDRFNVDGFYHPDPDRIGALNVRQGHFLKDDIAAFDAQFFSITPAEAAGMDPQQRGLLEATYRALENAGISLDQVTGTNTGVFVGCFTREYEAIQSKDPEIDQRYFAVGTGTTMLANRLSYFYDLRGPSVTLDTACSSSLTACHLACSSLRARECRTAIVAGCNLFYNPDTLIPLSALGFLSVEGRCYSFDHRANGYSRGEGFGLLVLKRLEHAIADGDTIRAVIRGTASNQDGKSPGITQPTTDAQVQLIKTAYKNAGLDPKDTRFFEAHGTGTPVGDPIEAKAIGDVFSEYRTAADPIYVGAVKTNIGHLEGSAGIAGLLKAILVLENGIIPPNINFEKINPKILADEWGLNFPTAAQPWPTKGLRRASVNAFGYGGSNAHVVLDDAYHYLQAHGLVAKTRTVDEPPRLLGDVHELANGQVLSNGYTNGYTNGDVEGAVQHAAMHTSNALDGDAHPDTNGATKLMNGITNGIKSLLNSDTNSSANGLNGDHSLSSSANSEHNRLFVFSTFDESGAARMAEVYSQYLRSLPSDTEGAKENRLLDDLAYTLAAHRTDFSWKFVVAASNIQELIAELEKRPKPTRVDSDKKLGLVFTGQGAQWYAMGCELLDNHVFKSSIQQADDYLQDLGCSWSLILELSKDENDSLVNQSHISQPACTAIQIALVELLKIWNVEYKAVVGHSSGEIAAAYAVGAISKEAAWKLAYYRGLLSSKLSKNSEGGSMLAAAITPEVAQEWIDTALGPNAKSSVVIACYNSPVNVTISGTTHGISKVETAMKEAGINVRRLKVDTGYHSPCMKAIEEEYRNAIAFIRPGNTVGKVSFFSSLHGKEIAAQELRSPDYWVGNLISPVKFSQAVSLMCSGTTSKARKLRLAAVKTTPITTLLEIGPHGALRGPVREILEYLSIRKPSNYNSLLRRNVSAITSTLEALSWLIGQGYKLKLSAINHIEADKVGMLVNLPGYPFNHSQKHWNETRISKGYRFRKVVRHELLGAPTADWHPDNANWRNYLRLSENPWVKDHRITGATIYPAAGMLVMAIEAARQVANPTKTIRSFRIKDVKFSAALRAEMSTKGVETHFWMRKCHELPSTVATIWNEFVLSSHSNDGEWREHCRGFIITEYHAEANPVDAGKEELLSAQECLATLKTVASSCTEETSHMQVYEHLSTVGLDFGPCFQTMRNIRFGKNHEAVASVEAPDIAARMPKGYVTPHLIHPTTLDGVLQSIIVALTKGGKEVNQVMVPSEIKDLWINGTVEAPVKSVDLAIQAGFLGIRQAQAEITAIESHTNKPAVIVKGFTITQVAKNNAGQSESVRGLCFNVDWKPDPHFLTQETANRIIDSSDSEQDIPRMRKLIEDVEFLCFIYIRRYLDSQDPETVTPADSHLKKYAQWMKHQALRFEQGLIPHSKSDWVKLAKDAKFIRDLEDRLESSSPEGKLCVTVGRLLPDLISGKQDALEVLFKDKLVENVYRHGAGAEIGYEHMNAYLDSLAHENPSLRILEIGAGTGGATKPVLDCLTLQGNGERGTPRFHRYDFTDVSIGFFEKAKEMFAATADRMVFKALNAENDVVAQGFEEHSYDVVMAANVIHATKSLVATLSNARKLLKPGGKLILYEMTNTNMIRTGFAFGLLPGWWLSEEDYRYWGPLASPQDWSSALQKSGFSGVDIDLFDFVDQKSQLVSVLVSSVPEPSCSQPQPSDVFIVTDSQSEAQGNLAKQLTGKYPGAAIFDIKSFSQPDVQRKFCIFLADMDKIFLEDPDEIALSSLQNLVKSVSGILWLTTGGGPNSSNPKADLVAGFARCMRSEVPGLRFTILSLASLQDQAHSIDTIAKIFNDSFSDRKNRSTVTDNHFHEENGIIYIPRVVEANNMNRSIAAKSSAQEVQEISRGTSRALSLRIGSAGLLDTLRFEDSLIYNTPLGEHDVEVEIKATGLNLLDVMIALGQVIGRAFGQEGSGVVTRAGSQSPLKPGDRVCGLVRGCFDTYARAHHNQWTKIPDDLSHVEAAAIPVVYSTAYYGLVDIGRLQKGETVLIHWGSGGLGQAAIQLALWIGARVITTCGSVAKRDFLRDTYGIPEDHILASRDLSFVKGVMRLTSGRGVDVVLNSMSGQGLRATWECIAPFGRFIEAGKVDIFNSNSLPMSPFKNSTTFSFIDVGMLADDKNELFARVLRDVIELVKEKRIGAPQPLHQYNYSQIQEAFRTMQSGTHIGKFVLQPHQEDIIPALPSSKPTWEFSSQATYVITGGMGGLGRAMAKWMTSRGARNIVLLSRSGMTHPKAARLEQDLKEYGADLYAPSCDVANETELRRVLGEIEARMPPIRGAILGAMVLKDALFDNMQHEDYLKAVRPKVKGSWNMHNLLPRDLDFFLLLSSASGMVGNRGQSNYCVGNTFQDALARHRVAQGLKAVSIDLGMILSVGFAAESQAAMANLRQAAFTAMREDEYFVMLETICDPALTSSKVVNSQILIGIEIPQNLAVKGIDEPGWMKDPIFKSLFEIRTASTDSVDSRSKTNYASLLVGVTVPEATEIVTEAIVEKLGHALSLPAGEIDTSKALHTYGVDSLVAVELRTWFMGEIGADVAVFDIMNIKDIKELAALAAKRSSFVASEEQTEGAAATE